MLAGIGECLALAGVAKCEAPAGVAKCEALAGVAKCEAPAAVDECEVPTAVVEFVELALYMSKFAPAESKSKDSKGSNPSSLGNAHWRHSSGAD